MNSDKDVLREGSAPRRWAGRAARMAGGLALAAGLGLAGAGAASAVEVNPQGPSPYQVEVNPLQALRSSPEVNPQ